GDGGQLALLVPVAVEALRVHLRGALARQQPAQVAADSGLPVAQRAVAVKGQRPYPGRLGHVATSCSPAPKRTRRARRGPPCRGWCADRLVSRAGVAAAAAAASAALLGEAV